MFVTFLQMSVIICGGRVAFEEESEELENFPDKMSKFRRKRKLNIIQDLLKYNTQVYSCYPTNALFSWTEMERIDSRSASVNPEEHFRK